jgi:hypothetical protein
MPSMSGPQHELPTEIVLTLTETAEVLFALDVAVEHAVVGTAEHVQVSAARRLITAKLWPELGDLLGDSEPEG